MVENEDSAVIGAHINDIAAILLRMEGIKDIVDIVIKLADQAKLSNNQELSIQKYLIHRGHILKNNWSVI